MRTDESLSIDAFNKGETPTRETDDRQRYDGMHSEVSALNTLETTVQSDGKNDAHQTQQETKKRLRLGTRRPF